MTEANGISRSSFLGRVWALVFGSVGVSGAAKAADRLAPPVAGVTSEPSVPLYRQEFQGDRGKTREEKVQELMDREEIRELIGRYSQQAAHGLDVADWFTDDGVFLAHVPDCPPRDVRGIEALHKNFSNHGTMIDSPKPMNHNFLHAVHGDEAFSISSNEVRLVRKKGESIIGSGYYQDRLRRVDGRWKFAVREAQFYHWVPLQEGWAQAKSGGDCGKSEFSGDPSDRR